MSLTAGTRFGAYEVLGPLGAGGLHGPEQAKELFAADWRRDQADVGEAPRAQINATFNWGNELKQRVPTK